MSATDSNTGAGTAPVGDAPPAAALHPVASTAEPAKVQPKGVKKDKPAKKVKDAGDGPKRPLELDPKPAYFDTRIEQFVAIQEEMKKFVAAQPREPIEITLPDGTKKEGTSWETSPMSIAQGISKSLSKRVMISKVDGQLWDLERPLEKSCSLELLDFEHPEGKKVFWHSSAHVLGEAAERHYGCHLCLGPPTEDGFFYEMGMTDERVVMSTDYDALTTLAKMAVKEKQPFERIVATKEQLLRMFQYNKYKLHMINTKVPDGSSTTVYRCGPMIDLCVGPHIPNTNLIGDFAIMKNSASYFLGDIKNDSLQRIYGVSFPDKEQMKKYQAFLAEAAKRDHRRIGKDQELFFFHELSPGSCFWLPHGTRIYNTLVDFVKGEYRKRGYSEVISPNMYNAKLWQTSGHWDKYADGMFQLKIEDEQFGLKPMNCPGHCLIFGNRDRSYRELPIRMADFGVLHRNEASGALSGLTRVRRFQQDDAHHFCMPSQIKEEIAGIFDLLNYVYGLLGFTYKLVLSTRPEKYLGEIETWDHAEKMLAEALDTFVPGEWVENPQDGAFYGPKIDITISDALGRRFQCATIQLDFQLPQRFNLRYVPAAEEDWLHEKDPETGELKREKPRPVMIHRAIMGSVERFTAILTEHFGGKWPFWLSPRQAIVVPIAEAHKQYAISVQQKLWDAGLYADVELTDSTIQKKVRNAEIAQYNFILVVGAEEMSHSTVNVRNRDDPETKNKGVDQPVDEVVQKLVALKASKQLENKI